jgi:outer membrane protein OmpA-like peptidoglycan-associated protein
MNNKKYILLLLVLNAYKSVNQELFSKKMLDSLLTANYEVQKMNFNKNSDELGSFEYNDTIYFSSNRRTRRIKQLVHKEDGSYVFNMYRLFKDEKKRDKIRLLEGDVNTKLNESLPFITQDGSTMYFTANSTKYGVENKKLRILKATKKNGNWVDVIDLPINSDAYSNGYAVLNTDESEMYFVSDRHGNTGDSDIYKVQIHADGTYGIPERLSDNINTLKEEISPFISKDNELYFSSKGHPGVGGFDVFYLDLNKENTTPINLGPTINSPSDDFGFSLQVKTAKGFVNSNKEGNINVYKVIEKIPLKAVLENLKAEQLGKPKLNKNQVNDKTKETYFFETEDTIQVSNDFSKKNQPFYEADSLHHLKKYSLRLPMTKNKKLEQVNTVLIGYFDHNSSYLLPLFKEKLSVIAKKLINNRNLIIEFQVYADSRGSTEYNLMITKKRLKNIKDYLIKKGVYHDQFTGNAYGEDFILNDCIDGLKCNDNEHKINRRVTYKLLKKTN